MKAHEEVALEDCPVGLFMWGDELCLKTEYGDHSVINAYVASSGEFFAGGTASASERRKVKVRPVLWPALKLQVNERGSWKDVCEFHEAQLRAVQEATVIAQALSIGLTERERDYPASWRITRAVGRSPKVVGYLVPPKLKWRKS